MYNDAEKQLDTSNLIENFEIEVPNEDQNLEPSTLSTPIKTPQAVSNTNIERTEEKRTGSDKLQEKKSQHFGNALVEEAKITIKEKKLTRSIFTIEENEEEDMATVLSSHTGDFQPSSSMRQNEF